MTTSVNTNVGAMAALQNLKATNRDFDVVQNRINTGLKVSGAKDNGAVFAIAQNLRANVGGLTAVQQSLDRATSAVDVAISAAEAISDILVELKQITIAASDKSLDTSSRQALNEDFQALRDQITTIVDNAEFNTTNLLKAGAADITPLANSDGSKTITVRAENLSLSGTNIILEASRTLGPSSTTAQSALSLVSSSLDNVNKALARLGTGSKKLEVHNIFVSKLQDAIEAGIGNLVDADLAEESAKLQALQVKQQLGIQALGIANASPQNILALFQ